MTFGDYTSYLDTPFGMFPYGFGYMNNGSCDLTIAPTYSPSIFNMQNFYPKNNVLDYNIFGYTPTSGSYFGEYNINPPFNVFPHAINTVPITVENPFWNIKYDYTNAQNSYFDMFMNLPPLDTGYNFLNLTSKTNYTSRPRTFSSSQAHSYRGIQTGTKPTVSQAIRLAKSQIGVREVNGSNDSYDIRKYKNGSVDGQPWCASFASWLYGSGQNGNNGATFGYSTSSQEIRHRAEAAGYYADKNSGYKPKEGDLMIISNPDGNGGHVGLITEVSPDGSSFTTVEGNSGNSVKEVHRDLCTNNLHGFVKMNEWLNAA